MLGRVPRAANPVPKCVGSAAPSCDSFSIQARGSVDDDRGVPSRACFELHRRSRSAAAASLNESPCSLSSCSSPARIIEILIIANAANRRVRWNGG